MEVSQLARKIIVTAALPYANGKLHLGHLRSTYIPADIYARYLRLRGCDVLYVCATDEHGTPISVRAETEGVSPKQVVDKYHRLIRRDLEKVGCSFDIFSRTTLPAHYKLTQEFFKRLLKKNYIYEKDYEQLFCPKCKRFLPDRYVEGSCPHCGYEEARGDSCDGCGRYLKPTELIKPHCIICGSTPSIRRTKHWFFKLGVFQDFLEEWLERSKELPANVKNYALGWLREGLKDWCITRDLEWGVPVPVKGAEGKVVYVWFDAPIGYVSSTMEWAKSVGKTESWREYWQREGSEIVHFIGKDIIYHHSLFWPAMLRAHGDYNLPNNIVAGEYLTLEGKKISKSRGWVIEVEEHLKSFEPDPLRYYLTATAPLDKDADFSWQEYAKRNNDELADIIGNFVHRSLIFVHQHFNGQIPEPTELDEDDRKILEAIKESHREVKEHLDHCEFHAAIKCVIELAALGNRYLSEKEPWKTLRAKPKRVGTILYVTSQIVKALAILLEPFLPFTAERIWAQLDLQGSVHQQRWEEAVKELPAKHKISKPKPLFTKMEPENVELQKKILHESLGKTSNSTLTVSMEEFSKLDLRVGKILDVEKVPGAEKLLKLTIDIGGGKKRQSVAGIAPYYTIDQLKGKQVAAVTNLKPRKVFGIESQVMILAVVDNGEAVLLQPERAVRTGSRIK